ncbi:MAG: S8 family peptidase [Planctomycetota bacterium]
MADRQRRLILGNGEQYIQPMKKKFGGGSSTPPRPYADARDRIKADIASTLNRYAELPKEKCVPGEAVFCLRMHPDASAKSYSPSSIFSEVPELNDIGSRMYRTNLSEVALTKRVTTKIENEEVEANARLVFVQSSEEGFQRFAKMLDRKESSLSKQFRQEIRRLEAFNELLPEEQIVGFDGGWREGRIELVMHPTRTGEDGQQSFLFDLFEFAGIDASKATIRPYPNGPTFISVRVTRDALGTLAGLNPLRSAHPLSFGGLPDLRNAAQIPAPKPPASATRSTIKVGIFDGGIDDQAPLLQGHAEEDTALSIQTLPELPFLQHGTAVAGAALYGTMTAWGNKDRLPTPPVYVVSFRVFPTKDPSDVDLYECIDVVERAVPARKDIKVFNLSFGPRGPIEDDPVSRFTFALDSLAVAHKVTFCVAAGNDGEDDEYNRIQAPSDLVHGLGIGAYTLDGEQAIHAAYSCRGPGRECSKVKPDVVAFGGCPVRPMHLVSMTPDEKILQWGTSFASPIASALTAQASEIFDRSSALLGRALVVHTAYHPNSTADNFLGHGRVQGSVEDILLCGDDSVTVVFQGATYPKRIVRLPIPWPAAGIVSGEVDMAWTIAALSGVDPAHPGDYTSCCLEDTFYANASKYIFKAPKNLDVKPRSRTLHMDRDSAEIAQLKNNGWKSGGLPVSTSGNQYRDEESRRMIDCKWESIVRRGQPGMKGPEIENPFIALHALGRNGAKDQFEYAVAVTLKAKSFAGDLYTAIRQAFPALAPIRLRTEAETRIQI